MRLLDQLKQVIRKKHYSYKTEEAYVSWAKRYILFHNKKHPADMGEKEISEFVSDLALNRNVAASTQNQALNAVVFLYKYVLKIDLGDFGPMERAKRSKNWTRMNTDLQDFKIKKDPYLSMQSVSCNIK